MAVARAVAERKRKMGGMCLVHAHQLIFKSPSEQLIFRSESTCATVLPQPIRIKSEPTVANYH